MIKVGIIGYGNIGKHCLKAVTMSEDMKLVCVIRRNLTNEKIIFQNEDINEDIFKTNIDDVKEKPDVMLLCVPTRSVEYYANECLKRGINTIDSFDIHKDIYDLKCRLDELCKNNNAVSVISCGFDPGVDSVIRNIMECCTSSGITYTDFGVGMSMGHSVVAKSKKGVKDAVSLTVPMGYGIHKRIVYVELIKGYELKEVAEEIKKDDYFINEETVVYSTDNINDVKDMGHGVTMKRKGIASGCHNQMFMYDMRINNPAVTAQVMVNCGRASIKLSSGAYTMIEVPPIYYLNGEKEDLIKKLV